MMICSQCPRNCNAKRSDYENLTGFCKSPLQIKLARAALHYWEEPIISGTNGSGTIFFSGCPLRCVYCQNSEISSGNFGKTVTVERLAEIFKELETAGAHNINLVTPTHYVYAIKAALDIYRPNIPIVYNSSGYEKAEVIESLKDYVDIYLLDFKYTNSDTAAKYSKAPDYPDVAKAAVMAAYNQKQNAVIKDGIMQKGIIVRHLLLPQHTAEATEVFDFVKENCPGAYFSLMAQYTPCHKADSFKELSRRVTKREYEKVSQYILSSGFENCFLQELSSAKEEYTPDFDLSGI